MPIGRTLFDINQMEEDLRESATTYEEV